MLITRLIHLLRIYPQMFFISFFINKKVKIYTYNKPSIFATLMLQFFIRKMKIYIRTQPSISVVKYLHICFFL